MLKQAKKHPGVGLYLCGNILYVHNVCCMFHNKGNTFNYTVLSISSGLFKQFMKHYSFINNHSIV